MAETNTTIPKTFGTTLGQSGTYITGGIITLEEYNQRLVGRNALQQYDIMRRSDSTIRGILLVVKLPLLSATWKMKPAHVDKNDPEATAKQKQADYKARFIERELHRKISLDNVIRSMLSSFEFGFDVQEKTLELTDFEGQTRIGIANIAKRKQVTLLRWETKDGKPGFQQLVPKGATIDIPMEKLIVFSYDKEGDNYEGISLLRYVYKDWDIKDKLTVVNAIALEKLAVGVPKGVPRDNTTPTPADLAKVEEILSNFRANQKGYIQETETVGIEMMDMKGNSTKDVIPTLNYHDSRISKSALAGFLEIGGHSGSGSQALAKDLTSLFMKSESAMAKMIISTLHEQLIKQLCDLNFTDMSEGYPELTVSNLADDDVTALSTAMSALVTAGAVTPDATMEDKLREIMGMPPLPEDIKENYQDFRPKPSAAPAPTDPIVDSKSAKDLPTEKEAKTKAALINAQRARRRLIDTLVS